ncbi:MAG: agmatine deiminase [Mycoplasmoidaceae bacterium]
MSILLKTIPKDDGYTFPAEFEPHEGTWIIWPERNDNWRDHALPAQKAFTELATAIAKYEKVWMGVSKKEYEHAKAMLPKNVEVVIIENNDAWVRDTGPTILINRKENKLRGVDWTFNAWGGKVDGLYDPWDDDDLVAKAICEYHHFDRYRTEGFVLEGGSIHTDGEKTLFVTEACLLSKGRNPHLNKEEIANQLKEYLGIDKIIWLKNGIYLDETNEHVDNIIQVAAPGKILLHWTDDQNDPQYQFSKSAYDVLSQATDAMGRKFEIIKIPAPNPLIYITKEEAEGVIAVDGTLPRKAGDRQAASYINHYIANGAVFIPAFNIPTDQEAYEIFKQVYPDREIVQIKTAREIILGGGNIHCVTQQIPKIK